MKKRFILAAMLAATPCLASAAGNGFSYTTIEGGYTQASINENDPVAGDVDADGGYLRGSFEISPSFYLFGSYARATDTENFTFAELPGLTVEVEDELTEAEGGVGYHMAMGEHVDFLAELAYLSLEREITARARFEGASDQDSESLDQNGGRISLGLRGGNERVEGWFKLGYVDGGDFGGDFIGTLGGQYRFNRTWGLVGEVQIVDDVTRYNAGVRASF